MGSDCDADENSLFRLWGHRWLINLDADFQDPSSVFAIETLLPIELFLANDNMVDHQSMLIPAGLRTHLVWVG